MKRPLIFAALIASFITTSYASALSLAARSALRTPVGEGILAELSGLSKARVSAMNPEEKLGLFNDKFKNLQDPALAKDIENTLLQLSQGSVNAENRAQDLIASLAASRKEAPLSLGDLQNPTLKKPLSKNAIEMLWARVRNGEFSQKAVQTFASTVGQANRALGIDILGKGAQSCLKEQPQAQINNFMQLISALKTPGALRDIGSAFSALVARSQNLFGEVRAKAVERVCGLAGHGYNCQLTNPVMCVR